MIGKWLFTCLLFVCGTPFLGAQTNSILNVRISCPQMAKAGDTITVKVEFDVKEGWHMYAPLEINEARGLYVTTLKFPEVQKEGIEPGEIRFSQPPLHGTYAVFQGNGNEIIQKFYIRKNFGRDSLFIKGKFEYQACSDRSCLPPASISIERNIFISIPRLQ